MLDHHVHTAISMFVEGHLSTLVTDYGINIIISLGFWVRKLWFQNDNSCLCINYISYSVRALMYVQYFWNRASDEVWKTARCYVPKIIYFEANTRNAKECYIYSIISIHQFKQHLTLDKTNRKFWYILAIVFMSIELIWVPISLRLRLRYFT